MKLKNFMKLCGLGLFAIAGASAFAASKSAAPVKAEGDWMITICFDNTEPESSGSWGYVDNQNIHFWGTNVTYAGSKANFHPTGRDHYYAVTVRFSSDQSITGMQICFDEDGVEKQSQDISVSISSGENGAVYNYGFTSNWNDGKWAAQTYAGYHSPIGNFNGTQKSFVADPSSLSYSVTNVSLEAGQYVSLQPYSGNGIHGWDDSCICLRTEAKTKYVGTLGVTNFSIKETGIYDFFINNEFTDGGTISIRKYEAPVNSYIYYVLESNTPTNDYIYSWGGSGQFGAWPGTKVTEVAGVSEVSGNGVMHFQGSETPKLIYKIPVTLGYPTGDSSFQFNNNDDWESEDRDLVAGAAYWYTGPANADAGAAIDFIVTVEAKRNAATGYSVCNISAEDSAALVDAYGLLDDGVKAYVDSSSTYTHKRDGSEGDELVSFAVIMEQLAKQAGGSGSSVSMNNLLGTNGTMVIVILATVATTLASVLLIVKFRKRSK